MKYFIKHASRQNPDNDERFIDRRAGAVMGGVGVGLMPAIVKMEYKNYVRSGIHQASQHQKFPKFLTPIYDNTKKLISVSVNNSEFSTPSRAISQAGRGIIPLAVAGTVIGGSLGYATGVGANKLQTWRLRSDREYKERRDKRD